MRGSGVRSQFTIHKSQFTNSSRNCIASVLLLAAGVALHGQTFRSRVVTVPVTATVVDAQGRLVRGLTRDDFQVFEDGVEQPVTQFTDERVPVSLGLLLDASDSMRGRPMVDASAAVEHFVGDLLMEEDEAFIALFNHRPRLAATWTRPASALKQRLGKVQAGGGTAIYDAVVQAAPFFDRRARPRAALVVISDGADTASTATLRDVRSALLRNDVFVYAIAIDSADAKAINARVNVDALRDITNQSGGRTELVRNSADLADATARIADELNNQYLIGYTSPKGADGAYHSIRVRIAGTDYRVRARNGYVATRD